MKFTLTDNLDLKYGDTIIGKVGLRNNVPTVQITQPIEIPYKDLTELSALSVFIGVLNQKEPSLAEKPCPIKRTVPLRMQEGTAMLTSCAGDT